MCYEKILNCFGRKKRHEAPNLYDEFDANAYYNTKNHYRDHVKNYNTDLGDHHTNIHGMWGKN